MTVSPSPVLSKEAERLRASVRESTADPRAGIFGPSSVSWKVNRESALFLGAGRAALLQLAHPWVAAALDQHSTLRSDPLARFHNTFRVVFTMVFGTVDQALAASRHLYRLHTRIRGELPNHVAAYAQGSRYQANEANALLWVYATLVESAIMAHDLVLPPLSAEERETYYAESKRMAALFAVPEAILPAGWTEFESYTRSTMESDRLGANALSRELAQSVLHGRGSWVPVPRWYRELTAAWLPERLRDEFGLEFGACDRSAAVRASKWLPRVYRRLPAPVRFVGPYQEATARLAGRASSPLARWSNRFWMGHPAMMFGLENQTGAASRRAPAESDRPETPPPQS